MDQNGVKWKVGLLNKYNKTRFLAFQCKLVEVKSSPSLSWAWPSSAPACIWSLLKQINKNSYNKLTWLYYTYNRYSNNHFKYFYQQTTKPIRFDVKYVLAWIKHHTAVIFPELFTTGGVIVALYFELPQVFSNIFFLVHGQQACNTW